jgi:hypothetical protein
MDCLQPCEAESATVFQAEVRYTEIFLTLKGGPFSFRLSLLHHVNPASLELRDH